MEIFQSVWSFFQNHLLPAISTMWNYVESFLLTDLYGLKDIFYDNVFPLLGVVLNPIISLIWSIFPESWFSTPLLIVMFTTGLGFYVVITLVKWVVDLIN